MSCSQSFVRDLVFRASRRTLTVPRSCPALSGETFYALLVRFRAYFPNYVMSRVDVTVPRYLNLSDALVGNFEQFCRSAYPDNFESVRWLLSDGNPVVREDLEFPSFGFGQRIYPGGQIANRSIFINAVLLLWAFKITKTLKTLLTSLVLWMG
ncbi:hypothetical protein EDD22DRAFT_956844 [Suillus occidentalis]|nr:hypothetical protein EDD22DRAFT_956844 [Suillus occidentalis]